MDYIVKRELKGGKPVVSIRTVIGGLNTMFFCEYVDDDGNIKIPDSLLKRLYELQQVYGAVIEWDYSSF